LHKQLCNATLTHFHKAECQQLYIAMTLFWAIFNQNLPSDQTKTLAITWFHFIINSESFRKWCE